MSASVGPPCEDVDDLAGEEVAVAAAAPGNEVAVDDDVLVDVHGAHVTHVAEEVVVRDDAAPAHELGHRRGQPHAVADDPLQHIRLGERALEELGRRRQLLDVLGVAEPVGDHPRGHDDRGELAQSIVVDALEALVDLERHLPLVARERQAILAPEPRTRSSGSTTARSSLPIRQEPDWWWYESALPRTNARTSSSERTSGPGISSSATQAEKALAAKMSRARFTPSTRTSRSRWSPR